MQTQNKMTGKEAILFVGRNNYGPKFSLEDPQRLEMYRMVYLHFTGGPDARKENIDPRRSVLMIGSWGVGKSWLWSVMQALFRSTPRAFKIVKATEMVDMVKDPDLGELYVKETYGKLAMDLYIDDIGIGQADHRSYGNAVNIVSDILMMRYDLWVKYGFKTHMSTNLPIDDPSDPANTRTILKMYGERVLDRLKEMTEPITWTGKSLREG